MSRTITLTDEAALIARQAICEARKKWPVLESIGDSEVLKLLMAAGLVAKEPCV